MFNSFRNAAIIASFVLCNTASAQCFDSLWGLVEVFSNADGSGQFLVLQSAMGSGVTGTLAGDTLLASDGSTEHSYTFAADLQEQDVYTRHVLVATQGFARLNLVKPDVIVPDGFVFLRNGSLRLASGEWCGGAVHYDALPTDGVNAYFPDTWGDGYALTDRAWAANNAGDVYSFTLNYGGLWWNAPAGSEPGSGIAIDHQRDIVFAAWATHDPDGSPAWFVVPRAERAAPFGSDASTYSGPIYRASGPAFGMLPFDPSAVNIAAVGLASFDFSDSANGTFSYTIGAAAGRYSITRQNIMRQAFADPVPVCNEVGPVGAAPNFQGLWWNPTESGWGLYIAHQGSTIFAVWFAYDTTGKATWLRLAASRADASTYAGPVYRTTGSSFDAAYDPAAVTDTQVGDATLTFADRDNGTFSFTVNGITQNESITRQVFADPPTVCN